MRSVFLLTLLAAMLNLLAFTAPGHAEPPYYVKQETWWETLRSSRGPLVEHIATRRAAGENVSSRETWKKFWDTLTEDFTGARAEGLSEVLETATVFPAATAAVQFHVAVDGNDENPGTAARPFATLHRARDAVRELKQRGPLTKPIRVIVHGGTYYANRVLTIGPQDSGTEACPVLYEAAKGETVVLSAGRRIETTWQTDDGKVYYTDLPDARDPNFDNDLRPTVIRYDDAEQVKTVGKWTRSTDWLNDGNTQKGEKRVVFSPDFPEAGRYAISTTWKPFGNRARRVPVTITHSGGSTTVFIDQTKDGEAVPLGTYTFAAGKQGTIAFDTTNTTNYVAVQQIEYVKMPDADRPQPWRFRQLFVNGQRAILARHPNYDASDIRHKGWLYVREQKTDAIVAGLAREGDWLEYAFDAPKAGRYLLWLGVATTINDPHKALSLKIDGKPVPLLPIHKSNGWREVAYSKAAEVDLTAGRHTMRWENTTRPVNKVPREVRVHLDAFVFSTNPNFQISPKNEFTQLAQGETRFVIEAEDEQARTGGECKLGFTTFPLGNPRRHAPTDRIYCEDGVVREAWHDAPQGEIYMFPTWCWFNSITWMDSIEKTELPGSKTGCQPAVDTIHIRGKEANTQIWPGNRFYVFNVRLELDAPSEWFLDYRTGRLFHIPREGESMETAEVTAPVLDRVIELVAPSTGDSRVEYVAFRGFTFQQTDYTSDHAAWRSSEDCAVLLENAWHCAVEDCTFTNIGGYAIRLSLDSCINRIEGNRVTSAGAGGVILRGPWVGWGQNILTPGPEASILYPAGNLITSNHVHHCGVIKKYVAGIHAETRPETMAYAPGNVFSHNLIHDMPRNGIFGFRFQGGYVVEYNHIYRVLEESDDGGLIHFCAAALNGTAPAIYRNNLVHDVRAYRWDDELLNRTGLAARSNGHGIYLDGETSHCLVENNIVSNTRKGCGFIHSGENNAFRNNIFLNDRRQHLWQTETWTGNRFEGNIVYWTTPTPYYASIFIPKQKPSADQPAAYDRNVIWHAGQPIEVSEQGTWEEWRAKGFDKHSIVADPLFEKIDLPNRVCHLNPQSPAFALGFRSIDLSRVGLREKHRTNDNENNAVGTLP